MSQQQGSGSGGDAVPAVDPTPVVESSPGWYPSGNHDGTLRWWDGTDWTDDLAAPVAPAAGAARRGDRIVGALVVTAFSVVSLLTIGAVVALFSVSDDCRKYRGGPFFDEQDCEAESQYPALVIGVWFMLAVWLVVALGTAAWVLWRRRRRRQPT